MPRQESLARSWGSLSIWCVTSEGDIEINLEHRTLYFSDVLTTWHPCNYQVKTRIQTAKPASSEASRGALSLLVHIFRTEGIRNLYKGVGPPLLSLSIVNTVSFTSYSFFNKTLFFGSEGWDWRNAASGMCGSPFFGLITTPENLIKTQMQLDNVQAERHRGRFKNSFHCAQSLVKTHGVTILYTGHLINTFREACFVGTYFFCYEGMKQEFQRLLVKMERRVLPSSKEERWSSTFAVPMAGELSSDLCQERQYQLTIHFYQRWCCGRNSLVCVCGLFDFDIGPLTT